MKPHLAVAVVGLGALAACSSTDAGLQSPSAVANSMAAARSGTEQAATRTTEALSMDQPVVTASSGCMLPTDSIFRANVSTLPLNAAASSWDLRPSSSFHPDFGSGKYEGKPFGIPVTTVTTKTASVPVTFDYADESDGGGYRISSKVRIEGGPDGDGDRHALLLDRTTCKLQELYALRPNASRAGSRWLAGSGARWNLRSNAMRPAGWTSADAAGLPIEPLLVSYADVARGDVRHAIRFTMPATSRKYVWPASHQAGRAGVDGPPMGAYFRLKSSVPMAGFGRQSTVIVKAMKKYGVVLADNGSAWFLSGTQDSRWDNDDLNSLKSLTGSDFEAVDVSSLRVSAKSYARK